MSETRPQAVTEDYADDYETLRDVVIALLNPRDDDIGEVAILQGAIESATGFIIAQPCECTPAMIEDYDSCRRCSVLGRLGDKRIDR